MTLRICLDHDLPPLAIMSLNAQMAVSTIREGGFHKGYFPGGCGRGCRWNGGGYYTDTFTCGEFFGETGMSFFCSTDCRDNLPDERSAFLSYRHKDQQLCDYVTKSLIANGIDVIRDVRELDRFARVSEFIRKADNSRYFIPFVTEDYLFSAYCLAELWEVAATDSPVRTVPIIAETIFEAGVDLRASAHWKSIVQSLKDILSVSSTGLFDYLVREMETIEKFPRLIVDLISEIQTRNVPTDLTKASCVYLVGILKKGSRPNERTRPEHRSGTQVKSIGARSSALPIHALFALDEYDARQAPKSSATSDVMYPNSGLRDRHGRIGVVLSDRALSDQKFVEGLLILADQTESTLFPVFADPTLEQPFSELEAFLRLEKSFAMKGLGTISIDVTRIGPTVTALRDTLA